MLSLEKITYAVPKTFLSVLEDHEAIGITQPQAKVYSRLYGLQQLPVTKDRNLFKLLQESVDKIIHFVARESIKYIIHVHTGAVIAPFGESIIREIKYFYGLSGAQAFGTSFNKCTSLFLGFDLAEKLLAGSEPGAKAIIISGELAFSRDLRVVGGVTLTGEAAGVALVNLHGVSNTILAFKQITDGRFAKGIWLFPKALQQLELETADKIYELVYQTLNAANIKITDIKCLLPHNINIPTWLKLANKLKIDPKKIYLNKISTTAHCFCSDLLINFLDAEREGLFQRGDYLLLVSIGVGATFAASVMKY